MTSALAFHRRAKAQRGFSLIEIAIVLTVLGIVLGMGLQAATRFARTGAIETTEERLAELEEALILYVARNARLPCPSDASDAPDDAGWGASVPRDPAQGDRVCSGDSTIVRGVPWRELGLPGNVALDGWKRRISYFVFQDVGNAGTISLVKDNALNARACVYQPPGGLAPAADCNTPSPNVPIADFLTGRGFTVEDENGAPILFPATHGGAPSDGWERGGGAAFVLVSHGADGCGGFDQEGIAMPACSAGSDQADNAAPGGRFVDGPTDERVGAGGYFDDHIRYISLHELIDHAQLTPDPAS